MEGLNIVKIKDFITIETHFGVSDHFIRANTRNKCSEDLVIMIQEVAGIIYPNEDFDIYLLPSESGSYRDIIKLVGKNKGKATIGAVGVVGTLVLGCLTYKDMHEDHLNNKNMWVVDNTMKCLELKKLLEDSNKDYDIENVPEEKISEVCGNVNLKKRKNSFYNVLQGDKMIENNETVLKDVQSQPVFSKKIERNDFEKYIEPIPDTKYLQENNEGMVELISPVVKQKKEGKGISWRGTYYGNDILYKEITILNNGDDIEFYMQDSDFKKQISNKERVFTAKDNMKIVFNVSGELKGGIIQNRAIYIKEVKSYNEEIIPHELRQTKSAGQISHSQSSLFDNL